jgi:hypothetical protein
VHGLVTEGLSDGPRSVSVPGRSLADTIDEDETAVGEEDPVAHDSALGKRFLVDTSAVGGVGGDL